MEFLILMLLALSVWIIWRKPQKEALAFIMFAVGAGLCFFMYFVASFGSVLPFGSY